MNRRACSRAAPFAAGLLLALAAPRPAAAQQGPPSQTETAAAIAQRNFGLAQMHAGHPEPAVAAFERSLGMVESPNTRLDLARALEATHHVARALREYERARDTAQARADAGHTEYELTARAASEQAEALRPLVPTLTLHFVNGLPPEGTVVTVGDASLPADAIVAPLPLDPGHVVVTVRGPAVSDARVERDVREGDRALLDVTVRAVGFVRVGDASLAPGTSLLLDGRALEPGEAEGEIALDPGRHELERLRGPGHPRERVERLVSAGQHVTLEFPNERSVPLGAPRRHGERGHALGVAGAVVGAVGVVAVGIGLGAWVAADATYSALLRGDCGGARCTPAVQNARADGGQALEAAGVAMMVGGVVLALSGAGLVLVDRARGVEAVRVSPTVGLGAAGVRVAF